MSLTPSSGDISANGTIIANTLLTKQTISSTSSDDPSWDKWSSLIFKEAESDSPKLAFYKKGLNDPGSGEICAKYISMSDSDLLLHQYYLYPSIKNPGIEDALQNPEPRKIYDYDGQDLYLDLCKQMNVIPVRSFYRGLLKDVINLRYYGINPVGVRAMSIALTNNKYVKRLDLTSNYLNNDACYHLGKLLVESFALEQLVLSGCKIKGEGLLRLVDLLPPKTLELLDLSKNDIGDTGFTHLTNRIIKGVVIKRLNLSYNDLTSKSALALAEALKSNNKITHLDLSWNMLIQPKGINELLVQLSESEVLVELNLSRCGLTIGTVLRKVLAIPTLQILDLSNNRLSTEAAKAIKWKLKAALRLETLELSHNPFTTAEALMMLKTMRNTRIQVKELLMEGIVVTEEFVQELNEVLALECRVNLKVSFDKVIENCTFHVADMRYIVMKRLNYIVSRPRRCKMDIGVYFLQKQKEEEFLYARQFIKDLQMAGAPVDEDLINEVVINFPGPRDDKGLMRINLSGLVEFVHRLWPEKKPPPTPLPTPPPTPPPPPVPEPKVNSKKRISKK